MKERLSSAVKNQQAMLWFNKKDVCCERKIEVGQKTFRRQNGYPGLCPKGY